MKRAGIFAGVLAFGYLAGAFVAADFNIAHWEQGMRFWTMAISVVGGFWLALIPEEYLP